MYLTFSETGSEQSDIEGRISALSEQLHQCKAEAERLRREAKRTRNERLIAKEQSLHKQLQVCYDCPVVLSMLSFKFCLSNFFQV